MAELSTIRAAIVAVMQGVDGIGIVHDRERWAKNDVQLRELYVQDGRLLGWWLRRVRTREASPALGLYDVTHEWRIRGVLGFEDAGASELTLDDLVEALRDAFRADETLGGVVVSHTDRDQSGLQVESAGPVMFAGVLCHGVTCSLITIDHI